MTYPCDGGRTDIIARTFIKRQPNHSRLSVSFIGTLAAETTLQDSQCFWLISNADKEAHQKVTYAYDHLLSV